MVRNKTVNLKQIDSSSSDTLKVQRVKNAYNATQAQTATIGLYASNDKTKGTIDQRLTALGV